MTGYTRIIDENTTVEEFARHCMSELFHDGCVPSAKAGVDTRHLKAIEEYLRHVEADLAELSKLTRRQWREKPATDRRYKFDLQALMARQLIHTMEHDCSPSQYTTVIPEDVDCFKRNTLAHARFIVRTTREELRAERKRIERVNIWLRDLEVSFAALRKRRA